MNILLTGYRGFIGSHLRTELEKSHAVYLFERGDDWQSLVDVSHDIDIVVHQGAISDTMNYDVNDMMSQNFEFSKTLFDLMDGNFDVTLKLFIFIFFNK